jgi:hypothetical protein
MPAMVTLAHAVDDATARRRPADAPSSINLAHNIYYGKYLAMKVLQAIVIATSTNVR